MQTSIRFIVSAVALVLTCSTVLFAVEPERKPIPQPPAISEASGDAQQQIATFKLPQGWKCEVAAAEPTLANPVAFTVDNHGNIYVCESYRQNQGVTDNRGHDREWLIADLSAQTVDDRIAYHRRLLSDGGKSYEAQDDRIRKLIDNDGDKRFETSTVFASGFNGIEEGTGAGVLSINNKIYYTNIPRLWSLEDNDNDGIADSKKILAEGFGVRVAFRGHDMHGLIRGPDGRIYFSIGDRGYNVLTPDGKLSDPESGAVFRCELDGSKLEVFATGLRNPQELAFDDYGNLFTGDNNSDSGDKARWVHVVRGSDSGWRMMYQYLNDRGPFNREKLWYPYKKDTSVGYVLPPIANFADGPSGLVYYPGTGLDPSYDGTFFLVDFRGGPSNSGVRSLKLKRDGARFVISEDSQPIWNILATDIDFGPDGSIYVSDWVNGWNGEGKGRIYRFYDPAIVQPKDADNVASLLRGNFAEHSESRLMELLDHPDRRVRLESQWQLASMNWKLLSFVATDTSISTRARMHAVWGLGQIARTASGPEAVESLSKVLDSCVKASLAESMKDGTIDQRKSNESEELLASVFRAIEDANQSIEILKVAGSETAKQIESNLLKVLQESARTKSLSIATTAAALCAGNQQILAASPALIELAEMNDGSDPVLRHAIIVGLSEVTSQDDLSSLASHRSDEVRLSAVVALRRQNSPQVVAFLNDKSIAIRAEAARAIYDRVALKDSLPSLAALISSLDDISDEDRSSPHYEAFVLRVLNANYRSGTDSACAAIANFAANNHHFTALRIEALKLLEDWQDPQPLDRLLNRYNPIEARSADNAKAAFKKIFTNIVDERDVDRTLLLRTLEAASKLRLADAVPQLSGMLGDDKFSGKERANAIRWLYDIDPASLKDLLPLLVKDKASEVRVEATRKLVESDTEQAVDILMEQTRSKEVSERQAAWDTIGKIDRETSKQIVQEGVDAWNRGEIADDTVLNLYEAAERRLARDKVEQFAKSLSKIRPKVLHAGDFESQSSIIVENGFRSSANGGDASKGKALFFERTQLSCVRCHKVGEVGGVVGPPLTDLAKKKNTDYLLEAIVDPNATVAQGFETLIVLTDEGSVVSGIAKSEDEKQITLITAEGKTVVIDKDSVDEIKKGKSSMPTDLMKYMDRRELRDLVAYLRSLDGTQSSDADGHR